MKSGVENMQLYKVQLNNDELKEIQALTSQIASQIQSVEDNEFQHYAQIYAQDLPRSLRIRLNDFRLLEPSGLCLIEGYLVDDKKIGLTPCHWKEKVVPSPSLEEDIFFFLCAALLGDPIGWATQQGGYILHDVMPIKGHEHEQIGTGSEELITWHTEDAFHPYRTDYLGLMCLRNPGNVETTYACINDVQIDEVSLRVLFEKRFVIRPDESHLPKNRAEGRQDLGISRRLLTQSYAHIEQMNNNPDRVAVLFGDPQSPYIRLDPYFMNRLDDDPEAMAALDKLITAIDAQITGVALQPGQILFIDNYRVVHGRVPFKARFDGTDRWLRRLNIARDLRKSRDARPTVASRIIF